MGVRPLDMISSPSAIRGGIFVAYDRLVCGGILEEISNNE